MNAREFAGKRRALESEHLATPSDDLMVRLTRRHRQLVGLRSRMRMMAVVEIVDTVVGGQEALRLTG